MRTEELQATCRAVMDEVSKAIVGKREVLERVMMAILCNGHVLFEDYPGLAKTLTANCFAQATGCAFKRVQFTPDLLPADITGTYILDRQSGAFKLRQGPVFANMLLADEINRAPPKTQSALLEAMQERQVTLEGETMRLPRPFIVLATQNPIEYEGTYPLPEAQIDRFLIRTNVGYPSREEEQEILRRRRERGREEVTMSKVCSPERIVEMQEHVERMHVQDVIEDYIVRIISATREHSQVEVGASPRGSLALMRLSSARAALLGRDFVLPDDVKEVAVPALAHRLILAADPWIRGVKPQSVVESVLKDVAVPKVV
ncbi:MAG: MoxR family ATPase [Methanomassiliicoccales archaeon]|jgi:MoxR-like ATPase|nr:MoxR family ATPase [Methanomassiliicoccales archaeon]